MIFFRPMRRQRQQLSKEESLKILTKATSGTLALLGDNNYPYAVPLSYVYDQGCLYFHSAKEGHKIDAISRHNLASFTVIWQDEVHGSEYTTYYQSVIAFGRISILDDPAKKLEAAQKLGRRYNPNDEEALLNELKKSLDHMLIICLEIEHLTCKEAIELFKARKS